MYEENKVIQYNNILESYTMWMYWQKYFQLYYSNDAVRRKEAKINVKGTDPIQFYIIMN